MGSGILDSVEVSISQALQKGIKAAGTAAAAYGATLLAKHLGIQMTPEQELLVAGVVTGLLTSLRNLLKQKFPAQLGWL